MKEPVDHIARPQLPWRKTAEITECGYDATKVKTITRDEYRQRLKDLGQQRSALMTCMTCSSTASRYGTWEDDPRKALAREIEWETGWSREGRGSRLRDELTVIAEMIAANPKEFHARVEEISQRRDWQAMKAAREHSMATRKRNERGGL